MRIALGVEYDGSGFLGWQSQAHGNTVQDVLEAALAKIAGQQVRVSCSGRTDTGVHGLGQVAHFDVEISRPINAWVRGVNAHLPATVAVLWAQEVSSEFHARFSARGRRYRYLLLNRPVRPALGAGRMGWYHALLDLDAMVSAAGHLLGEHDFSAFRAAECQAKSPVKLLRELVITRQDDVITFDLAANAFLHHMVRNIVGALVFVGKGRYPPSWMAELLADRDRRRAPPTFSAAGLYFVGPEYDDHWRLPQSRLIMGASLQATDAPWPVLE